MAPLLQPGSIGGGSMVHVGFLARLPPARAFFARRVPASGPAVALALLAVALAVLDLARPYVGQALRPSQWAAGLGFLVALALHLKERGQRFREALPGLALGVFLLPTWVNHSRALASDGIDYYTYLRSIVFDHDLDLDNDFRLLNWRPHPNVLPVGAPILWSPFVLAVHVAREAARLLGATPPTGVEPVYQAAVCLATLAYGSAGLLLLMDSLRRTFTPAVAFWTAVLCWVGTPLRFYLSAVPSLAHGVEFFAAVLVLRCYLSLRERPDARGAARAGAACGLVFLVRSQDGLLLALPGIELCWRLLRGPHRRRTLHLLGVLALAFVVVALPQLATWQAMYGTPLLVPHKKLHGESFVLDHPELLGTLVSARGGLFASHPAILAAVAGLLVLVVRDPRYGLAALAVALAGWYVNASLFNWFQIRRFTGLVPILAPGLAVVLVPLARAGAVAMALLSFFVLRYDLAVDSLRPGQGHPAPVQAVIREMSDSLAEDFYGAVEPHSPGLAVRLLASYTGEAILEDGATHIDFAQEPSILRLPRRARYFSFSGVEVEDGIACRWVEDRDARLFLPLAWDGDVLVTLKARALETLKPQAVQAFWNDAAVGRLEMTAAWAEYHFRVPASAVRAGTNVLTLSFDRAPIYRRMRGVGPPVVRPAALAAIVLQRSQGTPAPGK